MYCSQLREAKEVVEAGKKKQQKQLQRLKEQLHVPAALMVRDALRKQVGTYADVSQNYLTCAYFPGSKV